MRCPHHPLGLSLGILEALDAFTARTTQEALDLLANERGIELEPALVQGLVDFGLLAVPEPA